MGFLIATAAVLTALFLHDVLLAVIATAVETRRRKSKFAQAQATLANFEKHHVDPESAFD